MTQRGDRGGASATLPDPEGLIEEQLAFYRADAAAYERWETTVFHRGGGGDVGAALRAERQRLLAELRRFAPRGRVLGWRPGPEPSRPRCSKRPNT